MTARDDCAKVTHLAQGNATGVANVDRALRTRFVTFNSLITDGAAAAQTWDVGEFPALAFPTGVTIVSAWLVPAGTIVKDGTGVKINTTSLFYGDGLGGAPVLLGAQSTKIDAWAAGVSLSLGVVDTALPVGATLRVTGVLTGGGEKYVPYSITVEYKAT